MVLPLAILAAYLVFCILVGLCGSQRRMGFTGTFLLSLVITPVIGLLVLLITGPSRRAEMARRAELARQSRVAAAGGAARCHCRRRIQACIEQFPAGKRAA